MQRWKVIGGVLIVVVAIGGFLAYTSIQYNAKKAAATNDLKEFGLAYIEYYDKNGKWAGSVEELKPILSTKSASCRDKASRDEFELLWEAPLGPNIPGADKRTFGFVKNKFGDKFATLYQDLTVKFITEPELLASERASSVDVNGKPKAVPVKKELPKAKDDSKAKPDPKAKEELGPEPKVVK